MIIPEKDRKRQSYAEIERDYAECCVLLTEAIGRNKVRPDSAVVAVYGDDMGDVISESNTLVGEDWGESLYTSFKDFGVTGLIHMEVITDGN